MRAKLIAIFVSFTFCLSLGYPVSATADTGPPQMSELEQHKPVVNALETEQDSNPKGLHSSPPSAPSGVTLPEPVLSPPTPNDETPGVVFEYTFGIQNRGRVQIERVVNPDGTSRLRLRFQAKSFDGTSYANLQPKFLSPELRALSKNGQVVPDSIQTLDPGLPTERIQLTLRMPAGREITVILHHYPSAELVEVGGFTWSNPRDIEIRETVSIRQGPQGRVRNFEKGNFFSLVPLTDNTPDPQGFAHAGFHRELETIEELNPLPENLRQYQSTTFIWNGSSRQSFNRLGNPANNVGQIIHRGMPDGTHFLMIIRYDPATGRRRSIQMNGEFNPDGRGAVHYDIWSEQFQLSFHSSGLITRINGRMTNRDRRRFRVDALLSSNGVGGERASAALTFSQ